MASYAGANTFTTLGRGLRNIGALVQQQRDLDAEKAYRDKQEAEERRRYELGVLTTPGVRQLPATVERTAPLPEPGLPGGLGGVASMGARAMGIGPKESVANPELEGTVALPGMDGTYYDPNWQQKEQTAERNRRIGIARSIAAEPDSPEALALAAAEGIQPGLPFKTQLSRQRQINALPSWQPPERVQPDRLVDENGEYVYVLPEPGRTGIKAPREAGNGPARGTPDWNRIYDSIKDDPRYRTDLSTDERTRLANIISSGGTVPATYLAPAEPEDEGGGFWRGIGNMIRMAPRPGGYTSAGSARDTMMAPTVPDSAGNVNRGGQTLPELAGRSGTVDYPDSKIEQARAAVAKLREGNPTLTEDQILSSFNLPPSVRARIKGTYGGPSGGM